MMMMMMFVKIKSLGLITQLDELSLTLYAVFAESAVTNPSRVRRAHVFRSGYDKSAARGGILLRRDLRTGRRCPRSGAQEHI